MPKTKRIGDKVVGTLGSNFVGAAGEVAIGGTILSHYCLDFLTHVREAGYFARDSYNTISDSVKGGPEGMRAAKSLDEALRIVESATQDNSTAKTALESYAATRKDFAQELVRVYNENETITEVADRLILQMKGFYKNIAEAANSAKPDFVKQADQIIIEGIGKLRGVFQEEYKGKTDAEILEMAMKRSQTLQQFYTEARKFYDSREKNENTVKEYCNHLQGIKETAAAQNQKLESLFPHVISQVKEGYEVEHIMINTDRQGAGMKPSGLENAARHGQAFKNGTNELRTEVGKVMPMPKYSETNYIDMLANPYSIALLGVIAWRGLTSTIPVVGGRIVDAVSSIEAAPLRYSMNAAHRAASYLSSHISANPMPGNNPGQIPIDASNQVSQQGPKGGNPQ